MANFRFVWLVLGLLIGVEGVFIALTSIISLIYHESDYLLFIEIGGALMLFGAFVAFLNRNASRTVSKREGYLSVTLAWVLFSVFGALPFWLSHSIPSYVDAFFETMSGFTTTGASVVNNLESFTHGMLFWRSLTQWLGGMGIILFSLALLPLFGVGGVQLFVAEVTGITKDKIHPRIKETAKSLWLVYAGLTLLEVVFLLFGGMSLFDAVCHSFTTMATGGYGTKQANIAYYHSPYIEYVLTLFMFVAGINFALLFGALNGKIKHFYKDEEFVNYSIITAVFIIVITAILYFSRSVGMEANFREAAFQVVSILSTTGYASADYMLWVPVAFMLLFALMFFSASSGSTSGGVKIIRITILTKNSYYELKRLVHPKAIIPIRINKKALPHSVVMGVLAFIFIYIFVFAVGSIVLIAFGSPLDSAMGAVATSLANIGPGLGDTGPAYTFSHLHDGSKLFLTFAMLLGRLELFTVILLFSPQFWKD